jgi:mRNA interferase MazF
MAMNQGAVWIVTLDPVVGREQAKTRPCVIVSRDELNDSLSTVVVAPITSSITSVKFPNVVSVSEADGVAKGSIKLEQVRCVDKSRLKKYVSHVSQDVLVQCKRALAVVFDLDE